MSHPRNPVKSGDVFGKWTVGEKTGKGSFLCRCECGIEKAIGTTELVKGSRIRGCRRCQIGFSSEEVYGDYRRNAKARGLVFDLTRAEAEVLFLSRCCYCGGVPSHRNGIDRIDNNVGYALENCVPCCSICNHMKSDLSVTEFLTHIRKIGDNQCHN